MSTLSNRLRRTVARHPLTSFFVLAYLLSWWPAPLSEGLLLSYGPAIAAVLVLAASRGRTGLAELWSQMRKWRVGWRWYLIAPGLILSYLATALGISLLLGATITNTDVLTFGVVGSLVFELALFGGMWEEPGWSGYSLPALQARFGGQPYGLLKANLVMGAMRAVWHVPLVVYGHIPWFEAVIFSFALQFIITWLYNRTQGSVPIVMLAHLTSNVIGGGIVVQLFSGEDLTLYNIVFVSAAGLVAVALNSRNGWSMGTEVEAPSAVEVTA